jgi:hypothetical protein
MIVHHGQKSSNAALYLSAITANNGILVHDSLVWKLIATDKKIYESHTAQPFFDLAPDVYKLEVYYLDNLVHHRKIRLRGHTMVDITIIIGLYKPGDITDEFDISQDENFNDVSCYQQRELERDGHRQLPDAEFNGPIRTPPHDHSDAVFDPAAPAADSAGYGDVKSHPAFRASTQFEGDPENSAVAENNSDVVNQPQLSPAPAPSAMPPMAPTARPGGM